MGARLAKITPTVCLCHAPQALRQQVRVDISNSGPACLASLAVEGVVCAALTLPPGDSTHEVLIAEIAAPTELTFTLLVEGIAADQKRLPWQPVPRLRVHLVQHSHHDVGYTNLPSNVLREHCRFLAEALQFAEATADYPDEARFRLVIEQAWSLQEFLRGASAAQRDSMGALLRRGDFELTALFGNMTTELCGPEELLRALYPSQRIARQLGAAITTAEHNDVPGLSWGLAQALTEAGVRLFVPQLPRYWNWCDPPLQTFWDEAVLFPRGLPGGFWWEAPSGKRVLLWDASGTGGDVRPDLPGLAERLTALVDHGYPYATVYWPVRGGARDNSPYLSAFCDTVHDWNERWAYPQLIVSTNARFEADLRPQLGDLPVFRGELPGQDYPVGSASTAGATGVNRRAQVQLLVGERLAALAAEVVTHEYPAAELVQGYEDLLWYDEHTWGHHFPAGPAALASQAEKQVHAQRAAALAQDVTATALARLADTVQLPGEGLYLVVFNPLPQARDAAVCTPLRELENCGSTMGLVPGEGYRRGFALTDRWHVHPPAAIVAGNFDLIDLATGESLSFQITDIEADDPLPHAPERFGLAQGGKRYGMFERPDGLARDLRFVAKDLPACGYRTYELRPTVQKATGTPKTPAGLVIENEFYRLQADRDNGRVVSLLDLETGHELLDPQAPHRLGDLVVRTPEGELLPAAPATCRRRDCGPVQYSLEFAFSAPGHPQVRQIVSLQAGVKRVEVATRLLKDPTPLWDAHLAFPFALASPRFRYESALSLQTPLDDYLPGAYWDEVAVQNWVRVSGNGLSVLWSSLEAPLASLGELSRGYTSPAHSATITDRLQHPPGGAGQLQHGWLYSLLCYNNLGTNFAVSQCGSLLFRHSFTTARRISDAEAVQLGWEAVMPPETIFTDGRREGTLPLTHSLLSLTGDPLVLLAVKRAEEGSGLVVRLWNPSATETRSVLHLGPGFRQVRPLTVTEQPLTDHLNLSADGGFTLRLPAGAITTVAWEREG